ncbi:hypothetical protein B0T26DRAFT_737679 [Lasiosphaeria miniovina]|uniref:Copper acquisition factor BIM1-like domain-containing protein n=1 Tax=Lasiosphaeria miniovina TaxID=1954250 RepID=A0AA40B3C3_9PEZI|nr:uncharacterized protein B0T26DRAFT_737679 [Lasiosphaeria miniovina]KAK0726722.1 hypothetical protein B0T26DRAFT_737679 [Lasiosphaeria miniovina]
MAPLRSLVAAGLLFLSAANAHFLLLSPPSIEGSSIDEDKEGNAPCGADLPDLSANSTTDFHVGGDQVALQLGHPQANWLIRGTLDAKASSNWTQLFPIVTQSGLGNFCELSVAAPKEWVGQKGIIGVACNGPDGILYQCAVVNFVSGTSSSQASSCTNGSSVTASFSSDSKLSALVGNPSNTSSSAPSSTSRNASPSPVRSQFPLGSLLLGAVMVLVGATLL